MAGYVNKVILIGRLGADPDIKTFRDGGRIANLRLATSESWKDRQTGERKERTEWHAVSIKSDGLVGVVERYMKKGAMLYVEGKLQTRQWEDNGGNKRYSTEIVVSGYGGTIIMLGGNSNNSGGGRSDGSDRTSGGYDSGNGGGFAQGQGSGRKGGWEDDLNDEIPF